MFGGTESGILPFIFVMLPVSICMGVCLPFGVLCETEAKNSLINVSHCLFMT